jgi:hypothetical protein
MAEMMIEMNFDMRDLLSGCLKNTMNYKTSKAQTTATRPCRRQRRLLFFKVHNILSNKQGKKLNEEVIKLSVEGRADKPRITVYFAVSASDKKFRRNLHEQ